MKKIFVLTILASLLLLLSGCGIINGIKDIANGNDMISLPISQYEGEENLKKLGDDKGYEIVFSYKSRSEKYETDDEGKVISNDPVIDTDEGTITIGRKDNIYWMYDNLGEGFAFFIGDEYVNYYTYTDGKYEFVSTEEAENTALYKESEAIDLADGYLFYGNSLDGMLKAEGETTILGRKCDTYTIAKMINTVLKFAGDADDAEYECSLAVDREIGLTMKLVFKIKTPGEKNDVECEITKFDIGAAVVTPTLPEPTEVEPE